MYPDTVSQLFSSAVRKFPDCDLIVSDSDASTFSYSAAHEIVLRIVSRFRAEGMEKGDRLCIYSPLHVESFLLFWAAMSMGLVFVPVDFNWPKGVLEMVLKEVGPRIFFCSPECMKEFERDAPVFMRDIRTVLLDTEEKNSLVHWPTFSDWLDETNGDASSFSAPEILPGNEAVILYTSGSTGRPKGVVLSHEALCRSGRLVTRTFAWSSDDVLFNLGEMHAMSGLRNSAVAVLHAGCSFLITSPAKRSNIFTVAECIERYGCTQLGASPITIQQFVQFKDRIRTEGLRRLKSVLSTGSNLSQTLMDIFHDYYGIPVLNYYGLTETAGLCIGNSPETYRNARGSIGLAIDCEARIINPDGSSLEDGQVGELIIRSDNLMSGYYKRDDLTKEIIRDGWLYTGDMVKRREDGHFVLVGRKRNIIKNAYTELIYLEEIELCLERHPRILEAAVCGYISALGDERMAAFVVPSETPKKPTALFIDLRKYLAAELGIHKIPSMFILRDRLPRTVAGKLLREQLEKEL